MSRIYLIRHGETNWNKEQRFQGITDIPLNENGKKQAESLQHRFKCLDVEAVYVSPLKRAYETAQIMIKNADTPVFPLEEFKEIDFGEWEGKTFSEIKSLYGKQYTDFITEPEKHSFPGESSLELVKARVENGLKKIKSTGDIVIVSHGGITRTIILSLLGMSLNFYRKFQIDNASVSVVERGNYGCTLICLNDTGHYSREMDA